MSTEDKLKQVEEELINFYKRKIHAFLSLCESNIEKLFLLNILNYFEANAGMDDSVSYEFDVPYDGDRRPIVKNNLNVSLVPHCISVVYFDKITITPQKIITVGDISYRVDFLIEIIKVVDNNRLLQICIECDGFDFHGRTKEQVNKDNLRDRNLLSAGYYVYRYSGSEVYHKSSFQNFKTLMKQILKTSEVDLGNYFN